ncbi:MAG: N-acetylmuramoyl-L-alanine amidase [Monoglobales bacterium]
MKILLIAGHGAGDPGAVGNGYREADLTRELVKLIATRLSKYANVTVFDISKDMYSYLKAGNGFNFKEYGYVVEIHFNAVAYDTGGDGKVTGSEILIHPQESGYSVEAKILQNLQALGYANRGVKRRNNLLNMNICKGRQGVSYALIEVCFIDDRDDIRLYERTKEQVAEAITSGIAKGFGLQAISAELPHPITNTPWYNDAQWWVKELGIADGTRPEEPATRAEVWQMLYRLGQKLGL